MLAANANTSAAFQRCQPKTAQWEGTWSNNKADPGGKTMFGVTEAKFHEWLDMHGQPRRPVRTITRAEVEQLFFEEFWLKAGCNTLFPGVDLATYDASVNSGVSRGRKWLLASLDKGNDHVKTVKGICARRLGFVQSLTNLWKTFGRGWSNRIADIEATGVAWALAAMSANDNAQIVDGLREEQAAAQKTAVSQKRWAGTSGTASAGSGTSLALSPETADQMASWVLGGLLVGFAVLAGYLFVRLIINQQRARAYERVADSVAHSGVA